MNRARPFFSGRRIWLGRFLLVLIVPVLILGLGESILRIAGNGYSTGFFVPAAADGFLLSNPRFGYRFFGPSFSRPPLPIRINREKPPGTCRIFVLGASAARGEPDPAFSFARVLEAMLAISYPAIRFEVINTGMTAVNSHVVLPVARECLELEPDLIIVYLGHNEVVGPFGPGSAFSGTASRSRIRVGLWLQSTRLGQLAAAVRRNLFENEGSRAWGGMEMYRDRAVTADHPDLAVVREGFLANLRDLRKSAAGAKVPLVLCTVVSNLKDQPPLLGVHAPGVHGDDRERFASLLDEVRAHLAVGAADAAESALEKAAAIDSLHAGLWYLRGRHLVTAGRSGSAAEALVKARDLDALRFRADTRINQLIRQVAGETTPDLGTPPVLLDVETKIMPGDIPGRTIFHEHVHLNFEGNYRVAAMLFAEVAASLNLDRTEDGIVQDPPGRRECMAYLGRTPHQDWSEARAILGITGRAPFSDEQAAADSARASALARHRSAPGNRAGVMRTLLADRPDDFFLRQLLGQSLHEAGDFAGAAAQWSILLTTYPLDAEWLVRRGRARAQAAEVESAREDLEAALDLNPYQAEALLRLAQLELGEARNEEARVLLERAVRLRPDDAQGDYLLGLLLAGDGDLDGALARFVSGSRKPGAPPRLFLQLGAILGRSDRRPAALSWQAIPLQNVLLIVSGMTGLADGTEWQELGELGFTPATPCALDLNARSSTDLWLDIETSLEKLRLVLGRTESILFLSPMESARD